MKKGRYKNLFGNMALFTLGNFVSKILVMLLVPFYTNVLTTSEYGIADGMQATLLLLVPLLTINIGEAALRYGIERKKDHKNILRTLVRYVFRSDVTVAVVCALLFCIFKALKMEDAAVYSLLFTGLFICNSIYESMILYCQGCEQVKIMIIGSISCTVLVIASNLYFLLVLKIGLYGYLYSQMISFMGAAIIMLLFMMRQLERKEDSLHNSTDLSKDSEETDPELLEKEMTGYGKSILLYSTSSWVNNALDRYFVLAMCGSAANGLYGVAYKIPAILTVFQRIFAQAWQISANKNYSDEDSARFFGKVYKGYQTVMTIGCSGLIMIVQLLAGFLFAKDFYKAWTLVPPLLVSVVFGALTGFLGSICLAFKDGKSMGRATGLGALVNIILNFVGIRLMGPVGAAFATMVSYFTMYVFAFAAVKKHVNMEISRKIDFTAYGLLLLQTLAIAVNMPYYYLVEIICFLVILAMYGRNFYRIIKEKCYRSGNEQ